MKDCSVEITLRDRALLRTLTEKVRALSLPQVAATWWRGNETAARRRLERLARAGLIELFTVLSHPLFPLTRPLASWCPGDPQPDLGRVARVLRTRWPGPPRTVTCAIASRQAAAWLGGGAGRRPRAMEVTHDLHLAGVYLRLSTTHPRLAGTWVLEPKIALANRAASSFVPDARVGGAGEERAIELGGIYSKSKLERFHAACSGASHPYEIW